MIYITERQVCEWARAAHWYVLSTGAGCWWNAQWKAHRIDHSLTQSECEWNLYLHISSTYEWPLKHTHTPKHARWRISIRFEFEYNVDSLMANFNWKVMAAIFSTLVLSTISLSIGRDFLLWRQVSVCVTCVCVWTGERPLTIWIMFGSQFQFTFDWSNK